MTDPTPETARLTADVADRDAETGLPFDSGVDTAVERWFRTHFHAAQTLGFPMAGYVAERDTQRRLQDRRANREAERELGRLRQEIVDAHGEATAEAVRADVAEAQRDQAREVARTFLRPLGHVTVHKALADSLGLDALPDWLTGEPDAIKPPPLTPGLPGYACARCGSLFTSPGEQRDEHSRHADSPWCRGCVDLCHEAGDGHRCVICAAGGAR